MQALSGLSRDFSFWDGNPVVAFDISFRSKEPVPQKVKQRIISEVQIWMGHYLALENLFDAMTSFKNPVSGLSITCFDDMENVAYAGQA